MESDRKDREDSRHYIRAWMVNFFLVLIILIVVAVSWWMGAVVGRYSLRNLLVSMEPGKQSPELEKDLYEENTNLPIYCFIGASSCDEIAKLELRKSAESGIRNFICKVDFPWFGSEDLPKIFTALQCLNETVPWGKFYLYVDLNPPETWFTNKSDAKMVVNGEEIGFVSLCSQQWLRNVEEGFSILAEAIKNSTMNKRIGGFMLGFLKNGMWILPGLDLSKPAIAEFIKWSNNKFPLPEQKWTVFGTDELTPQKVEENLKFSLQNQSKGLFEDSPILVLFREFINKQMAKSAIFITSKLKESFKGINIKVMLPYGFSLESADPDTGHFGFADVINSDVDSVVLPVSYMSRGAGDTGAPTGAIESIIAHGKEVLILDDTRTGVTYDILTRSPSRMKGIKPEAVLAVQKRNSGMALTHNAGIIWCDPEGKGWLSADEEWENIKKIIEIYKKQMNLGKISFLSRRYIKNDENNLRNNGESDHLTPKLHIGKANTQELETQISLSLMEESMLLEPMAFVVDERVSHRLSARGSELYTKMLVEARDQLLRVGLPVEFYLMQDLLEERIPPKTIYFIFSMASPSQTEIQTLHHIFESDKAIVLWYYLPGCDVLLTDEEKITELTQIKTKLYSNPTTAGSAFELEGRWVNKGENFGEEAEYYPLIYIEDNDADVLARYRKDGKCSIGIKTVNEKWVSVLCAEPGINFLILREILTILEIPTLVAEGSMESSDTYYISGNTMVIHTKGIGDRIIQFNQFLNLENLFQPEQKWFERETILLSLGNGETVFLGYKPR